MTEQKPDWRYFPRISRVIREDLKSEGIEDIAVGDENYTKKTDYYRAIGDDDVVFYAIRECKADPKKISQFDLILVDEYQDFNEIESELVIS